MLIPEPAIDLEKYFQQIINKIDEMEQNNRNEINTINNKFDSIE